MTDMPSVDEEMAARAAGRAQERRRLNKIFNHPAAARNDELAQSLAFGTSRSADSIVETLKTAGTIERRVQ
jgi:hypothetical protein